VALLGSTGRSTGPHLHFEIRYRGVAQNPLRFIDSSNTAVAQK
jgi:murein DD-endopeptidase MepM/ murein hydrolase activator NlpD